MVVGKSHRMVIEVEPEFKEAIYKRLKNRGLTLKEWFIQQVEQDLLESKTPVENNTQGLKDNAR